MSRISKKFIRFGTGTSEVNSRDIPANFTPTNYTPTQIASEGNDKISAHLNGINAALAGGSGSAGDISETSFTAADNQASAANVTGFSFANATVRSFDALVSIVRNNTYANYKLRGIQKAASWELAQEYVGDATGITFTITTSGQVQYTSTNTGFTATIKFRAITTTV